MNQSTTTDSWEELKERKILLKKKLQLKEDRIKNTCNDLFELPIVENKMDLYMNYAKAGYSAFDGFMTSYKLLKSFGSFLRNFKRKRK